CRSGRFGENCESTCHCEGGHHNCDKDGFCYSGCEAGWAGFTCQAGPIHGGSSVESGFEPAFLRSTGRDLTTRQPRPDLQWNRVSYLEPSRTEGVILPPNHRGLRK
ncbi:hypothetical protein AVEN_251461-1, partial [Araneus ventricosus]